MACLFAAFAIPGFLLRHFHLDQVLALASFVFLELLVIRSVSRMDRGVDQLDEPGASRD